MSASEKQFEAAIESTLLKHGYLKSDPDNFDRVLGLDHEELRLFIDATQRLRWVQLQERAYGSDPEKAWKGFIKRLAIELDERGTVDVLRHGITDYGLNFNLAFFKPAHTLTGDLEILYRANRVSITRQFNYDVNNGNSIDFALLVNGIPTATVELKNPLTNQNTNDAIMQYMRDRDADNVTLSKRALVHFAVDPDSAYMTTKLDGQNTRFLPFNQGTGGSGEPGRAGNPPSNTGHRTAYLWEEVWQRDAWLDLLARFVHVEEPEKGSKAERAKKRVTIFPRFHQWDAVRKLEAHAKLHGAGNNYLIQHSAGSGKSNTIAWITHRLVNLHDDLNNKIFDKVVVITDRLVLDRQLQETIYQFEHAKGVVVKIDENSQQLADALLGEQAKVIITTLQKFPYILNKIGEVPARNYAVVIDEAHSSQSGQSAKELRAVLSKGQDADSLLIDAERQEAEEEAGRPDPEDQFVNTVASVAGRGKQDNISFLAFTATPKAKTLELFGTKVDTPEGERFRPFHLYSMRQAIDEGFILDVLKNYTTYATYWKIEKAIADDPLHDKTKAKAAIARFVALHPTNLAQKSEIIVEHFRQHTARKINGRAKAMVVTSSRLHAVRYKETIDRYIASKNYSDVSTLVAFSGKVDDDGTIFTEALMNGHPESETAERFDTNEYQVLIVAEKFQTGFDQPLLHTMYVDKPLTGLHAVQTLSRLNRIMADGSKADTFVLDFRNETEDIQKAFEAWFELTAAIPTEPNLLWDTHRELMRSEVIHEDEIEPAVKEFLTGKGKDHHARTYAALDPALHRYEEMLLEDQNDFREVIGRFTSMYSFIAQIVSFTDAMLERDFVYAQALTARLPKSNIPGIDIGSEVQLSHLRTELTSEGDISIDKGDGDLKVFTSGMGPQHESEKEALSTIIAILNERFGLDLDEQDQLLFDQFEENWAANPDVVNRARNNEFENFKLVFDQDFLKTVVGVMDTNEEIVTRILNDSGLQAVLADFYAKRLYERLRAVS